MMTGGEAYEEEYDNQLEASDINDQSYELGDTYAAEEVHEEQSIEDNQDQPGSEDFDEDDQDSYM